jgi:hypothetical protein
MSKQQSVCKIYYLPIEGGKFEEVPTVEYQQPEEPCWQERLMDVIGNIVLCIAVGGIVSAAFIQIARWIWGW